MDNVNDDLMPQDDGTVPPPSSNDEGAPQVNEGAGVAEQEAAPGQDMPQWEQPPATAPSPDGPAPAATPPVHVPAPPTPAPTPSATPTATPSATPSVPPTAGAQQPGGQPQQQYAYRAPSQGGGQIPPQSPWSYQQTPPPPRRGMSGCVIATLIFLGLVIVGGLGASLVVAMLGGGGLKSGLGVGGDTIAVITISGIIQTGSEAGLFGSSGSGSREIVDQIRDAGEDSSVKAVILDINSPGGSAAASQAIYQEVIRLRDEIKKPVVVSMGDVCASGGYYVASAATTIVALPATMTGSIGVIMESINWSGLADKYGVKGETVTSGKYKDIMSPFRAMRQDERKLMQEMVDEVYGQFVEDVAKARKMNKEKLRTLADGRVYTGSQAKRAGLVDELGSFQDAVKIAAKKGGIVGEPNVEEYGQPRGLYGWLGEMSRARSRLPLEPITTVLPTGYQLGPGLWMILQGNQASAPN